MGCSFSLAASLLNDLLADQEAASERDFAGGQSQGFLATVFRTTADLDEHIAWADDCNPEFRIAFPFPIRVSRVFGDWFVREDSQPNLAAALHSTGGCHTGRFDLVGSQPTAIQHLKSVFTEIEFIVAARDSRACAALHLSMLYAFWH